MGWRFAVVLSFVGVAASALPLAPHLSEKDAARVREIVHGDLAGRNLEADEREYQRLVQRQTFADLEQLYAPESATKLQIAYPGFTAEGERPAKDLGYGLHVVKRLVLPAEGGGTKVIDVNEQWAENKRDGGLYLPDEIRIKTLVFPGARREPGSHALYLFDSIRLAYAENGTVSIHRRTRYRWNEESGKNELKTMRVPVSAPIMCQSCHRPGRAFERLSDDFLGEGEARNAEAIVQDSYFRKAFSEQRGFRAYVEHLEESGREESFIGRIREDLLDPKRSMAVPGLLEALRREVRSVSWLGDDDGIDEREWRFWFPGPELRQGMYFRRGGWWRDAVETGIEGKYHWWQAVSSIPTATRGNGRDKR